MLQRVLCWLFSRVYKRWLWSEYFEEYDKVDHVFGWRSARVSDRIGGRSHMSPCFWWFE